MFIMVKTQACSWSPTPDMNVKTVERFCWDVSQAFFNEFSSIEVIARPNCDLSNDGGEGMVGDMPLSHIDQSPSFRIERNNQEEECLKSLFKHTWLQNMTRIQSITCIDQCPGDENDSVWANGFLGKEIVRQIYLNDQRFNVNMVMYYTSLIRGLVLTWSRIVLFQELVINQHHERVAIWIR